MTENGPQPIGQTLDQLLDGAYRNVFGENAEAARAETERHQDEARELIERARRVCQELIDAALDRLTFFGGERRQFLGSALENTQAQRADVDRELHDALVGARERYNRRVQALMEGAKEE